MIHEITRSNTNVAPEMAVALWQNKMRQSLGLLTQRQSKC
jgi:hypothetical protein